MDLVQRFLEYAAAFERVYRSDAWSELEPFFTEGAVYEVKGPPPFGGRHSGRAALLAALRASVDRFDRRFARRTVEILDGPALRDDGVRLRWRASYSTPGLPELCFDGEELAAFEGDRIARLEDRFPPESVSLFELWMLHYGGRLGSAAA